MQNRIRNPMAALAPRSKIAVDITLDDDQHDAYVSSYTTLDKIGGEVSFTAPCDTRFDDILITFEGANLLPFLEACTTLTPDRVHQNICGETCEHGSCQQ